MLVVFSTGSPCAPSSRASETLPQARIHGGRALQRSFWMAGRLALEMTGAGLTAAHAWALSQKEGGSEKGRCWYLYMASDGMPSLAQGSLSWMTDRPLGSCDHITHSSALQDRRWTGGEGIEDRERPRERGGNFKESKQLRSDPNFALLHLH